MERFRARTATASRNAPARLRLSANQEYLPNVDGRSVLARRWRDVAANLISDQGGIEAVSTARLHLIKRLAGITSMLEEVEAKYVRGEPIDMDAYLAMVNASVRLSNTIGLNRKTKQVPDLQEYLRGRAQIIEPEDDDD